MEPINYSRLYFVIGCFLFIFAIYAVGLMFFPDVFKVLGASSIPIQSSGLESYQNDNSTLVAHSMPIPEASCGANVCGTNQNLLPVHDPAFNLKEIVKQMLLLEDHLFQTEKQCKDCIRKHFFTIEALAEEGVTLDTNNKYSSTFEEVIKKMRDLYKTFINGGNHNDIAQSIREIRKPIMNAV